MLLTNIFNYVIGLLSKKDGQGLVEYILLLGLIALVVIGALRLFGPALASKYQDMATKMP